MKHSRIPLLPVPMAVAVSVVGPLNMGLVASFLWLLQVLLLGL
jgi:hypothetical protein